MNQPNRKSEIGNQKSEGQRPKAEAAWNPGARGAAGVAALAGGLPTMVRVERATGPLRRATRPPLVRRGGPGWPGSVRAETRRQVAAGNGLVARSTRNQPQPSGSAFALRPSFGLWPSSFVILALCALSASAQQYSIDWSKVSGGGGTSTGGVYAVTGTLGQHDAGTPMTGGNFSLTGGFWSLLSLVQTTGSPLLSIRYTTTNTAVISWPSPSTGFNLQFATDLTLSNWANSVTSPSDDGTNRFLIVNPPTGNGFFRLFKP